MLIFIAFTLGAYLLGSISSAILICRIAGFGDPRDKGSGNPGTTNVLRIAGKKAAAFTLVGDLLKGFIPVFAAHVTNLSPFLLSCVGLAAFLGHLFPVFFGFKGGKGVATALGVFLALSWPIGLLALGTWIGMALIFRYSSLAALVMAFLSPFYIALWSQRAYLPAMISLSLLLIIQHRGNIQRLWAGQEKKIKF